jgi:adenylate kinase
MEQGALVPDDLVIDLIAERSASPDCKGGFILDGFPRNVSQATALDQMLKSRDQSVDRAVLFEIPDEDLVRRLSGRRTCVQCGAMYHVENAAPKVAGICDQCQQSLIQRDDDATEVIKKRLNVYHQQTEPLVGFYRKQGKLKCLDARQTASQVASSLSEALK